MQEKRIIIIFSHLPCSVNRISTLAPFEDCKKLQELYLRKNNIQDMREISYLQNLPALKYLWLEENPCCDQAGPKWVTRVIFISLIT